MSDEIKPPVRLVSALESSIEPRVQSLEAAVTDLKIEQTKIGMQIEHLSRDVADGFRHIGESVETGLKNFNEKVEPIAHQVYAHAKEIEKVAEERVKKEATWSNIKKAVFTITTGAAAILIKELVVWITKHM